MDDWALVGSKEEEVIPRLILKTWLGPIILFKDRVVELWPDGVKGTQVELNTQLPSNAGDVQQADRIKAEQRIEQGQ